MARAIAYENRNHHATVGKLKEKELKALSHFLNPFQMMNFPFFQKHPRAAGKHMGGLLELLLLMVSVTSF